MWNPSAALFRPGGSASPHHPASASGAGNNTAWAEREGVWAEEEGLEGEDWGAEEGGDGEWEEQEEEWAEGDGGDAWAAGAAGGGGTYLAGDFTANPASQYVSGYTAGEAYGEGAYTEEGAYAEGDLAGEEEGEVRWGTGGEAPLPGPAWGGLTLRGECHCSCAQRAACNIQGGAPLQPCAACCVQHSGGRVIAAMRSVLRAACSWLCAACCMILTARSMLHDPGCVQRAACSWLRLYGGVLPAATRTCM